MVCIAHSSIFLLWWNVSTQKAQQRQNRFGISIYHISLSTKKKIGRYVRNIKDILLVPTITSGYFITANPLPVMNFTGKPCSGPVVALYGIAVIPLWDSPHRFIQPILSDSVCGATHYRKIASRHLFLFQQFTFLRLY